MVDDDGNQLPALASSGEGARFRFARPGDHLMTPFQCELCHYRNLTQRNPSFNRPEHQECLAHMRRANLDAFWSREPPTVEGHLREGFRVEATADRLGLGTLSPSLGPFPLEDSLGMQAALAVLVRSQDKTGRTEEYVQPDTYRKAQTFLTNMHRAGVGGLGDQVGAHDARRVWISRGPTHSLWFVQCLTGLKRRTGEVIKRDKAVSIDLLHEVMKFCEQVWRNNLGGPSGVRAALVGAWYCCNFCMALRGEESPLIELAGTQNSMKKWLSTHLPPHFILNISGRTKLNRNSGAAFMIPCVATTQGTGLEPGKWLARYLQVIVNGNYGPTA